MDFDIADALKQFLSQEDNAIPIALGAQGVGTYLRAMGNRKVANTQNSKIAEELARQHQFQARNDATVAATLPKFAPGAQEASRQALAEKYRNYVSATLPGDHSADYVTPSGAPTEVNDRMAAQLAKGVRAAQDSAKSMADLSSYGGMDVRNRADLMGAGRDIGMTNRASANSSSILPQELQVAYRKGIPFNLGSDIANGVGSIAMLNGITQKRRPPNVLPGGVGNGSAPY